MMRCALLRVLRRSAGIGLPAIALTTLALLLVAPAVSAAAGVTPGPGPAERLDALAEEVWQHTLERSPELRIREGLPVTELPDLSHRAALDEAAWSRGVLERLRTIDPAELERAGGHERWLTHRILDWELGQRVEGVEHFWQTFQVTPYTWSFSGVGRTLGQVPVSTGEERARYLDLLRQSAGVAETLRGNLETRREKGILLPRPEIDLVVATFTPLAGAPAEHPFRVAPDRLAGVPAEEAEAFSARVAEILEAEVAPAFGRLVAVLDDDYREEAPETVGLGRVPGGEEAYRFLVRHHTGLDLTPEEIHRRGLAEAERIESEMAAVRELLGSELSAAEFNEALRSDPRFLACDPEGVAERLRRPVRMIELRIDAWFLRTPEAPYGVARLDPGLEAGMTYGYYQWPVPGQERGLYYFNGSALDQRPLVQAAALIYHELVPGHHFQIALQFENEALPKIRRNAFPTAFIEGWAEYASALAGEMGLYAEPYDRYGRLAMEMFLTARLVVDTGMNALGWSRERSLEWLGERVLESDTQLATETLRYSTDLPGQALAYAIGAATFARLREEAEAALGDRFDVRRFHEAVLGHGAMPLGVLEEHVEWWIERERAGE